MNEPWEGTVKVTVTAEFEFVIDSGWDATDADQAKQMVEVDLTDYLGEAWSDERFDETWTITEGFPT